MEETYRPREPQGAGRCRLTFSGHTRCPCAWCRGSSALVLCYFRNSFTVQSYHLVDISCSTLRIFYKQLLIIHYFTSFVSSAQTPLLPTVPDVVTLHFGEYLIKFRPEVLESFTSVKKMKTLHKARINSAHGKLREWYTRPKGNLLTWRTGDRPLLAKPMICKWRFFTQVKFCTVCLPLSNESITPAKFTNNKTSDKTQG